MAGAIKVDQLDAAVLNAMAAGETVYEERGAYTIEVWATVHMLVRKVWRVRVVGSPWQNCSTTRSAMRAVRAARDVTLDRD